MKSIPLALTWEFWRQVGVVLFATIAVLFGQAALLYGGLRLDRLADRPVEMFASLQMFFFVFVVVGLVAVICHATASPQYRFTLPMSIHASVLVQMINGTIAIATGYLTVAVFVNNFFHADWNLLKPTLIAICILSVCQAVAWMMRSSSNLRSAIAAGVSAMLGVGVMICLHYHRSQDQVIREWRATRPLDVALAVIVPLVACTFSVVGLSLARRGQVFSISAMGRWLLARQDIRFSSAIRGTTPMAVELWSEWTLRGRILLAGPILIAATLCGFFLSGRFEWESARGAIGGFTWVQVMLGSLLGLFIGHVGERFDFHEYSATLPLSDSQLADVKLRNTLQVVCWTWVAWAIGVAVAVLCLTLVGRGPKSWSDMVPPASPAFLPLVYVVMIPLCSWTLTSLGVSIVILRAWMVKTVLGTVALLPLAPYAVLYLLPDSENEVFAAAQWGWIGLTIGGTVGLYAAAFRLRLITAKRIAVVGASYMLLCAAGLTVVSFLPSPTTPPAVAIGFLLSSCILPFVCVAAVPLAIWWNRHR